LLATSNVTEYTRPATWDDLKALVKRLNEAGVDYALVGGYAIAAHGFNRFSEDIDILVDPTAENSSRWILALGELPDHAARELSASPDVFADDKRYALRINDEFTVDVMPSIAGHSWEAMRVYIETRDLDGIPLRILNLQGLLLSKQGVRPKDQMDAAVLQRAIEALRQPKK
jgi:ABC-type glycerol-3-phosphate transport system substrate-binding protein